MSIAVPMHPAAAEVAAAFHSEVVEEVAARVSDNDVVVVGMGWNPHVKRACRLLTDANIPYLYHEIGNYSARWRERLAVKLWSGWPTFPQVFVKGMLIGGADQVQALLESGQLEELLQGGPASEV